MNNLRIEFWKVTWYSKLAAIILFIFILPTLTFYIGMQYQETVDLVESLSTSTKAIR